MIPYSVDEVGASVQFLLRSRRAGRSLWRTLLHGGPALGEVRDETSDLDRPLTTVLRDFIAGGVNYPWQLTASVGIGAPLIASPLLVDAEPDLRHSSPVAGCLAHNPPPGAPDGVGGLH